MSEQPGDDILLAVITIRKTLTNDDIIVDVESSTPAGDTIALVDALGMIELGKDTLIRQTLEDQAAREADEDDD